MDLHPFEDAKSDIGVFLRESLSLLKRISFDDNQASCFVRQGAGQHHSALGIEWLQPCQVRRSMDFSSRFSFGAVEAKNNEFHRMFNRFWFLWDNDAEDDLS